MDKKIKLALLFVLVLCGSAFGAAKTVVPNLTPGEDFIPGQLLNISTEGPAFYCAKGEEVWRPIEPGMSFSDDYMIRTGSNAYLVLTWSAHNIIFVKPHSGLAVKQTPQMKNRLVLNVHHGELMVSARDSGGIVTVQGRGVAGQVVHGEMVFSSKDNHEVLKAVRGNCAYKLADETSSKGLMEHYFVEVEPEMVGPHRKFFANAEYESFRRFESFMKRFEAYHRAFSDEFYFKLDSVRINDEFLNNMAKEGDFFVIKTKDGRMPKSLLFQAKIQPYPGPNHRIELNLGDDLIYVFREGRNGYHEVNFELPEVPEFIVRVHFVDSHDRRMPMFSQGFCINNKARLEKKARDYVESMSDALSTRNSLWFRSYISQNYRDFMGNNRYDFVKSCEKAFREYRDARLRVRAFNVRVGDGKLFVRTNYEISALTSNHRYRYEKRGTELLTLVLEDGEYKLASKSGGLFFSGINVVVDLRRGLLQGQVFNELTGRPMAGVEVVLMGTSFRGVTDGMGKYMIANVPVGTYNVRFSKNGFGSITASGVAVVAAGR